MRSLSHKAARFGRVRGCSHQCATVSISRIGPIALPVSWGRALGYMQLLVMLRAKGAGAPTEAVWLDTLYGAAPAS